MTEPIAATGGQPGAKPRSTDLGALDGQAFLRLLVAQLKYQNPLQPTDPTAMLGQTAQLTTVEKLDGLADSLRQQLASQRTLLAAGMVGKTVTAGETTGVVTSVSFGGESPVLKIGATEVPLSDVQSVQ